MKRAMAAAFLAAFFGFLGIVAAEWSACGDVNCTLQVTR